ncbi:glutaredoxin family protein [Ferrimonas balearica]|uniref:glutaredoxin family protein n=1 Tax=Ferrimonas balearica TaxID=44012 RepID=UPI001C99EBFB|nr:glutaredoxin family protein [Ferrimonas balearica]MBY5920437.1 glutaredoxin family protein [Ferrimonas balearica]MBY5996878.1 glutaredoxin family protein [Ferrimonas balearica]
MPSEMPVLFHTDGCHLCEQAQALLAEAGIAYRLADIVDDPEWVAAYGVRIPVIRRQDGAELGWPFDLAQLNAFFKDSE